MWSHASTFFGKTGIAGLALIALVGCEATSAVNTAKVEAIAPAGTEILIDGSSTVYPVSTVMAEQFRSTPEGQTTTIKVDFSGTSAGFRRFCSGETDLSNASRPILLAEMETCAQQGVRFIEVPVAFDALTVAVNPQNTWATEITVAELKQVWQRAAQGKVTRWNQIRPTYPDQPLRLFGPGADSGTFDYFNEAIMGDATNSRSDYVGSEDDNLLVQEIARSPNALGYIPYAYYEPNQAKLKALAIDNGNGPIAPSAATVKSNRYQPLSRPLFIYINAKSAQTKPNVRAFVEFYLKNAAVVVPKVGYVPLSPEAYRLADIQFHRAEVGSVFDGVPQPEVTLEELLRRQAKFQADQQAQESTAP